MLTRKRIVLIASKQYTPQLLMKDFVQTYFNHDVSTEDFKRTVEEHMSKDMDLDGNQRLDWFFNEWVYGTEIPSYRFEYQLGPDGATLTGRITQSGVSSQFKMLVPIHLDFGKGLVRIGAAHMIGSSTFRRGARKAERTGKARYDLCHGRCAGTEHSKLKPKHQIDPRQAALAGQGERSTHPHSGRKCLVCPARL